MAIPPTGLASPAIETRSVSFRWPGADGFALHAPDFALQPGKSLFLCGPSGSGKTTLLNLLGGVLRPDSGQIVMLGKDIAQLSPSQRDHFRADHIGFIFQQFNLIPYLSVMENVLLPCRFSPARASRAAAPEESARTLLQQLDIDEALYRQPAYRLSVGQQQRVAAARALIGQPEILIADEPTSALDAARQHRFVELLLELAGTHRSAVIFVSHDLRLAEHFDQYLALSV